MRRESSAERAAWTAHVESVQAQTTGTKLKARGQRRQPKRGEMNKTEAAYGAHLELRKQVGEVLWYGFEAMTFKLANNVRLTPDFMVMIADGTIEAHDAKGTTRVIRASGSKEKVPFVHDDARIKMEVAAGMFPLVFKVVFRVGNEWIEKEY